MKKLFLGLLVLVGSQSFATSVMHTTLDFSRVVRASNRTMHQLSVYSDGSVVDRDYGPMGRRLRPVAKVVTRLTGEQMDKINVLIRRSQPEVMRFERTMIKCFAPSLSKNVSTAENFSVKLSEGDACDGFNVNKRPAAAKLRKVLQVLEIAAHNGVSLAEIDEQIDSALN